MVGGQFHEGVDYFRKALALDPEAAKEADAPIQIFRATFYGAGEEQFTFEEATAVVNELLGAEDVKPGDVFEVTGRLMRVVDRVGEDVIRDVLKKAYPKVANLTDPDLAKDRTEFLINHALLVEEDSGKALKLKRESMPSGWQGDAEQLNRFAWWCFVQKTNLGEAESLARRAVESMETGAEQANVMDTLAEILNLRGDTAGALEWIEKALALDPGNEYLQNQVKRFRGEEPA